MSDEYLTTALNDLADMYGAEAVLTAAHQLLGDQSAVPSATARVTDPDTSQAAGTRNRSADVGRFGALSRQAALLYLIAQQPMTAQEAALAVFKTPAFTSELEGCRRRVSDLVRAGYIIDSGKRRANPGSTDESIVWEVTIEGRAALDRLTVSGWSR